MSAYYVRSYACPLTMSVPISHLCPLHIQNSPPEMSNCQYRMRCAPHRRPGAARLCANWRRGGRRRGVTALCCGRAASQHAHRRAAGHSGARSSRATPRRATSHPSRTTPRHATPRHTASGRATPRHAASGRAKLRHAAPKRSGLHDSHCAGRTYTNPHGLPVRFRADRQTFVYGLSYKPARAAVRNRAGCRSYSSGLP